MANFAGKLSSKPHQIEQGPALPSQKFSRFDLVPDHSDHHFSQSSSLTNGSNIVHKKIMTEWKILEKDLPESIYVRAYETRIDLLRAVIVGPAGTPYQDGLFFFDLKFPFDYPNQPPLVRYRSFGLRLNPNLYACGKVCLSLLNTWHGWRKHERWDPKRSTILQVLVSIQGLVLNKDPYYNEPLRIKGTEKKNAAEYNCNVFILCCRTMLCLLLRPPKNFENFVTDHFRERASEILTCCHDYINGRASVGTNRGLGLQKVSKKFNAAMEPVYEKLLVSFTKNGASLGHFVEQLEKKKATVEFQKKEKMESSKSKKFGLKKIIGKIKKGLGLKKNNNNAAKF